MGVEETRRRDEGLWNCTSRGLAAVSGTEEGESTGSGQIDRKWPPELTAREHYKSRGQDAFRGSRGCRAGGGQTEKPQEAHDL